MQFGERLRSLRTDINMTQKELANKLSISPSTIGMYEQNRRVPDAEMLSKIASLFGVTTDYLLGNKIHPNSDSHKEFFFFFFDCWDECLSKIKNRLQELDISEADFCMDLNINLNEEVSINDLKSIANKLELSTDYLLGMSDIQNISSADILFAQSLSSREKDIIENFRLLNKDNQDIIVGELKKSLKEQRLESVAADEELKKTGTDDPKK